MASLIMHIAVAHGDFDHMEDASTTPVNETVGIIICKQDNEYVIKYCSDDRIISREYELL